MKPNKADTAYLEDRYSTDMPMLTHKFKEYFFHHAMADTLVCLEFNKYPNNLESYHLEAIEAEKKIKAFQGKIEQSAPLLSMTDSVKSNQKSPLSKRQSSLVPSLQAQSSSPKKRFSMMVKQQQDTNDTQATTQNEEEDDLINFQHYSNMLKHKLGKQEAEYEIGVSFWQIGNQNPTQILEQRFQGENPQNMKFSTDGDHIFVIYERRKPNPNWQPKEESEEEMKEDDDMPVKESDSVINTKNESIEDLNKAIVNKETETESESEDEEKFIMVKHIAIMTSDTLTMTYNGILGTNLETIGRADLIWKSQYLYINNPNEPAAQHTFYKVIHNEPESEMIKDPCFTLHAELTDDMPGIEAKDLIFTEERQRKIYTFQIMNNPTPAMKVKNEYEARLYKYELQENRFVNSQQGELKKSFKLKNIPSFSQVHANRTFTNFFVLDDDDYSTAYTINIKEKTIKALEQTHNEVQRNSFLYDEFWGICKDQDGFRQIADHKTEDQKQIESGLKGTTSSSFDIQYSETKQSFLEVVESQGGHLIICSYKKHGSKLAPNLQRLREMSGFSMNFPYLSCCKGNSELIIRNLHYTREQIVVPLASNQIFVTFVNLNNDHKIASDPIKEFDMYNESADRPMREELRKKYQQMKKLDKVDICYMTLNLENQYEIHLLRMFPYAPKEFFIAEQWVCRQKINAQMLSAKEICQAHIFTLPLQRLTGKRNCSTILMQTKDQLAVKFLTDATASPILIPCNSQIRAVYSENSGQREYFYVQDDKHGSAVKILSQKDNSSEPVSQVYDDQNNKILSMVKRGKYIFVLDENYLIRQLEIVSKDKEKSKLEPVSVLECTPRTRDQIIKHKEKLFTRFNRVHMSAQNVLHINGHFFRFFNDNTKMMQSISEEDLYQIDSFMSERDNRKYLRGPFNISDTEDNLAYFFEDSHLQGICVFKNCIDSKLNFLANVYCSYSSFLEQDRIDYEEVLVCIKGHFFIFMPNGEIQQEVPFLDPAIIDIPELKVEDVSDTLEYFVFQGIEKVYKLRKGDRCFEAKTDFFRVPQENEDKRVQRNKTIAGALSQRYGKVNPQPLNDRSDLTKQNEEDSYDMEEVIDGENEYTEKNIQESELQTYESKKFRYIKGSLQVGDEGSIWNLYYDTDKEKVFLRVDSKTMEPRYVPMQLQDEVVRYVNNFKEIPKVKMVLVEHYLVMTVVTKFMPKIYYLQVEQKPLTIVSQLPQMINLKLSIEWEFIDLKNVNADHRVQVQLYNKCTNTTALVTWNLEKNLEDRSLEIPDKLDSVSKGVNSTLNYCNLIGVSYDLEYGFPLTFFGDVSKMNMRRNFFEAAFSEGKDMICIRDSDSLGVSLSLSMLERRFLAKFDSMKNKLKKKSFPISMVNFRTHEGSNIFHYLIKDFKVLKRFQYSYMKFIEQFEDEDDKKKYLELFLLILYPNNKEISPFDIAMKESSQFVDLFLVMLTEVPDYALSRFIFKELVVFKQLMGMGLKSFETFLDRCLYQNRTMNKTFVRFWKHGEETEHIFQANSSLITNDFLRKNIGKHEDDPEEKKWKENELDSQEDELREGLDLETLRKSKMSKLECKLRKDKSNEIDILEKRFGGEKKRIDISMVEFDWVFQGNEGEMFVEELASTDNDEIFKVETIKICILFLWDFYFYRILLAVFIPYFVFFACFFTYATFVTDGEMLMSDYILAVFCTAYSIYSLCMETRQMYVQGKEYFAPPSVTWNVIDIASSVCALISTVNDLANIGNPLQQRNIMSLAIFFLWLKFFYFLRIFKPTSAFIRMITEIIKDMGIFMMIYLLANITIANAFFILDGAYNDKALPEGTETYGGVFGVLVTIFTNGLGDFNTDHFDDHPNRTLLWFYFLLGTVLITLVFLNLLIAIMGDTFDRVQEMKDEAMLKELCSLISDNWFWLNQEKTFGKTKYICVAKLEQADGAGAQGWEGKLATMKTFFQSSMQNLELSLKQVKQMQKDDIQSLQKTLSNQVNFMQQNFNKRTDQLEKQNKRVQETINKMIAKQQNEEYQREATFVMEEIDGDEDMPDSSFVSGQSQTRKKPKVKKPSTIVEDFDEDKSEDEFE